MPGGQLCFWNFSFLTESGPYISAGFKKPEETVRVQSDCSINKLYVDIQPEKRKPTVFFFETNGWDTSLDSKSENKYRSDSSRACLFFVCNNTSASGNFICLSSHGKILAESFQFDWKENIFYKLQRNIFNQTAWRQTNPVIWTQLLKCHDQILRRARSRNWNLRTRLAESWRKLPSAFSRTKTWIKKIYFRKKDSYSRPDKAVIIWISYKTAFIRTVLSVDKFTTVWNLIAYSLIWKKTR